MTYVKIWNELRMLQGQIYVLEIKKRNNDLTSDQLEALVDLNQEYGKWNKMAILWDKCGEAGFDESDNPRWELLND
jgi:hypothetical protein